MHATIFTLFGKFTKADLTGIARFREGRASEFCRERDGNEQRRASLIM